MIKIWFFDSVIKIFIEFNILLSNGDISYFGLVIENDMFYMFYYFCYIDN